MSKRTKFPAIRAELRQREAHSRSIHRDIRAASGLVRAQLWEAKRAYGRDTRCCLLLYAILRGKPRVFCEPVRDPNYDAALCWWISREATRLKHPLEPERIRAWLSGGADPSSAEQAAE